MKYRKKLIVEVPDDVTDVELRHPSGDVDDIEVDCDADDEDDDEET